MSSKKEETLWIADPHTIAKVDILENYLSRYFQIIGSFNNKSIVYVDGFAGPGRYKNHPTGSPLAALKAAKIALSSKNPIVKASKIHCIFVEERKDRCEFLNDLIEPFRSEPRIDIHIFEGDFVKSLPRIEELFPQLFSTNWSFFFIDPFGPTVIPFSLIEQILRNKSSEVFLNLDGDGIGRIFLAGESANSEQNLEYIFGGNKDWPSLFRQASSLDECARQALALYKTNLFGIPGVDYAFAYEMRGRHNSINYFLLFASHHPLGLIKMKEAMKSINKNGSYVFSDARVGQHELFSFDDPTSYANEIWEKFRGKKVERREVERYVLNETPCLSISAPLKMLETSHRIEVELFPNVRRIRGTFPEEKVKSIHFI